MASHKITITVPETEIGKADVVFKIRHDRSVIGTVKISKGGIEWVPRDKSHGIHKTWKEFADLIEKQEE